MIEPYEQFKEFLKNFGEHIGHDLTTEDNICALADENDETAVIIELPENSDLLLLHRMLTPMPTDPELQAARAMQLLSLNGAPDKLKGAWFYTDQDGMGLHLMTSHPVGSLTHETFKNLVLGYIELANTLTRELKEEEQELVYDSSPAGGIVL
ncbi:type III secretion system chaperone [Endozoicomonas sp. 8E]|uniref:type III secretion system chaperone n=1 Tax=Endozoicomonas sp. 8E TaxID=3035692 RepID=UPI00293908CF|nr:type III secretion system chaperone [Endozoicomonas sp. 8E]WOG29714.1 type III secretion system chaperone [Endozoicomonas sp. 8E]